MLVLTERVDGEGIELALPAGYVVPEGGLSIDLSVVSTSRNRARLGFDAPDEVRILRKSVINAEQRKAG